MKTILGLELEGGLSRKEWCELLRDLVQSRTLYLWKLGDLLNYGLEEYGESFVSIQANIGYELSTLYNLASVCKRVPLSRRRAELSFSHHAAVATLSGDQQKKILNTAIDKGLSCADLRQLLRADSSDEENTKAPRERSPLLTWLASGIRLLAIESRGHWPEARRKAFASSWSVLASKADKIINP